MAAKGKKIQTRMNVKASERTEEKTVRCREIIGLSGTRAWREASNASVCVCPMKDFSFLTNTLFWSVCVWGRLSLCAVPPRSPVRVQPIVRWQSRRASCRYALSHREHLIHQHMNTHTLLGGFLWDREHRGGRRERGRVKVRTKSLLPTKWNWTFSGFYLRH